MPAELVAISGALSGERFPVDVPEIQIGRAPASAIHVDEPEAAWRHCVVRASDDRVRLTDLRTGSGTFVNGLRVTEHLLEDGDQISIGDTVLLFRNAGTRAAEDSALSEHTAKVSLLRACSVLFLFRALIASENSGGREVLEGQLIKLMADFVPATGGAVLIGRSREDLSAAARARRSPSGLEDLVARSSVEGLVIDNDRRLIAAPVYARTEIAGVLVLSFGPSETSRLAEHADVLTALATLAKSAAESEQQVQALKTENALLQERIEVQEHGIVGSSPAIRRLLAAIDQIGPQPATVLVLGESGTGKELVARALHVKSPRRHRPLVAINCAAITETLLESELFGHEKGAFTGAVVQKKGKLEVAEGGTVFLDEIAELAPSLQAKLLRVLQQREFERVGGTRTLQLDVRLIAATNRDLGAEVRRGAFREDLYYRLNVISLRTPPLRDRREDIPDLAAHFVRRSAARCGRHVAGLSPEAERSLVQYAWPGNVRELENAIERAVVLGASEWILPEDLPETVLEAAPESAAPGAYHATVGDAKRESILRAWEQAGGDYKIAAKQLGLHPNSLLRLIRNLGLRQLLS